MAKSGTSVSQALVKLGFTSDEARVYERLIRTGSTDVRQLALELKVLPNALYRLLAKLAAKNLVTSSGSHPKIFRAISPSVAFDSLVKNRMTEYENLKETVIGQLGNTKQSDATRIDLLNNTAEFYQRYAELARVTKKEIRIISIGEAVPEEIYLSNRDALERGVRISFIAHKYDKSNQQILKSWLKMGLSVRHYPDWGFHLVVFDRDKSLLSVNNPLRTSDRIALVIYSQGLAKAHADYFDAVWEKAKKI